MTSPKTFYDGVLFDIQQAVDVAIKNYKPNLREAVGVVPGPALPTTGPSAPGAPPGTGYPPADNSVTETKIADGSVTEAKLAFDVATQDELDDEIAARTTGDTALAAPEYLVLSTSGTLTNERRLVIGQGLTANDAGAGGDYTLAVALSGSGVWRWRSTATTSDPGTGLMGVDDDSPSLATVLWANKQAQNNVDYSGLFSALRNGDTIYLQQANAAASWHRYEVTGTPTLSGNAFSIPVSTLGGSAQGTEPANNADVYVIFNAGAGAGVSLTDPYPVHGIRVAKGSNASALYVPWVSGDTVATATFGSSNTSNVTPAIYAESYGSTGVIGVSNVGVPIGGRKVGAVTNAIGVAILANHRTTGTPAAGLGSALKYQLQSSTTADQDAAQISAVWSDPTHATKSAYLAFATVNAGGALTEQMRLTAAGNFGVGALPPGYLAEFSRSDSTVARTGAIGAEITVGNTSTGGVRNAGIRFRGNDTASTLYSTSRIIGSILAASFNDAALIFQTASASETFRDVMTLRGANVGIGTTAPATTLQVRGTLSSMGFFDADNVGTTEVEILPSGGAVYYFVATAIMMRTSAGALINNSAAAFTVPAASSTTSAVLTVGGETLSIRVYSTGRVTMLRTAGTATYKVTLIYHAL